MKFGKLYLITLTIKSSIHKGITVCSKTNRYIVQWECKYIGRFKTEEEALDVIKKLKE